jgi:hypothetical protein
MKSEKISNTRFSAFGSIAPILSTRWFYLLHIVFAAALPSPIRWHPCRPRERSDQLISIFLLIISEAPDKLFALALCHSF